VASVFDIDDRSSVTLKNLVIRRAAADGVNIALTGDTYDPVRLTFINVEFSDNGADGIAITTNDDDDDVEIVFRDVVAKDNTDDGIQLFVDAPSGTDVDNYAVTFKNVVATGNGAMGVNADTPLDQTGSHLVYTVDESNFSDNTAQGFFLDAADINDAGDVAVTITETTANNNGGTGIELDDVAADDDDDEVMVTIKKTVANGNTGHGIEIDGSAEDVHFFTAVIEQVTTNGNTLDGIHVDMNSDLSFVVGLDDVTANSNDNRGVFIESSGDLVLPVVAEVVLQDVVAKDNGNGGATDNNVRIIENNAGASLDVKLVNVRTSGAKDGSNVFVEETGAGDVDVTLDGVVANGSVGASGVQISETGGGTLALHVDGKVSASDNSADGVRLTETGGGNIVIAPNLNAVSGADNGGVLVRAGGVVAKSS